ncbi:MAG: protein phosphatase CheZ [Deltaproteobacteria bacterium]|nr:protein phosphatase CheZ [Deltaproteobacteria bacterium]
MSETANNELMEKIKSEFSHLAAYIEMAKAGVESLADAVRLGNEKFPEASGHLNMVTNDLENAANSIMTIVEGLMEEQDKSQSLINALSGLTGRLPESDRANALSIISELSSINSKAKTGMTDMFANLSFHDLSGQKLKKVIAALGAVEEKIHGLADSFGFKDIVRASGGRPASEQAGYSQSAVDELIKGLGAKGSS